MGKESAVGVLERKKHVNNKRPIYFFIYKNPMLLVLSALATLLSVVFALDFGIETAFAAIMGAVIFSLLFTVFKTRREFSALSVNLITVLWSLFVFWVMQVAITPSLGKIFLSNILGEKADNLWFGILSGTVRMSFNIMLIYSLILLVSSIFRSMRVGLISVLCTSLLIGVANSFVVQSRGREISFLDIKSIGTAMAVVGDYSFELELGSLAAIMMGAAAVFHICQSDYPRFKGFKMPTKYFITSVVAMFLCIVTVFSGASLGYASKNYYKQGTEYNGYYLNFIYSIKNSKIKVPDTYSYGAIMNAISRNDFTALGALPDTNVIVVMNETFSDLKSVCDSTESENKLVTDVELLPYWHSLQNGIYTDENGNTQTVIKGDALSSVYGGNTANSEFEFLFGSSMAFLPEGTVAYNGKVNQNNSYTVVNFFNDAGYKTVAIHPEAPENWSRNTIYKYFGFDQTFFWDDFASTPEEDFYRGHISDKAVYDKIIELYETKQEDEKLFTFAITMMNHGGYDHEDFEDTVHVMGDEQGEANEYLSSVNESDRSLKYLIDYFSAVEEDTLIVFFGDHQPTMTSDFLGKYMGITSDSSTEELQKMYVIPYMFFSNFEASSNINEGLTSINYLSTEMMNLAGVEKSKFFDTLDNIRKTLPAINYFGWYDSDGDFHSFTNKNDPDINPDEKEALELYEHLAYNLIFDSKNKLVSVFDTPEPTNTAILVYSVGYFHDFRKAPKVFDVV